MEAIVSIIAFSALIASLIRATVTDIRERKIPNRLVVVIAMIWLTWRIALIGLEMDTFASIAVDLVCALVFGALLLAFITLAERLTGKFMMGGGDVKLLAAVSLFLGIRGILVALFAACILSFAYAAAHLKRGIPLAPCILCGTLLALLV